MSPLGVFVVYHVEVGTVNVVCRVHVHASFLHRYLLL